MNLFKGLRGLIALSDASREAWTPVAPAPIERQPARIFCRSWRRGSAPSIRDYSSTLVLLALLAICLSSSSQACASVTPLPTQFLESLILFKAGDVRGAAEGLHRYLNEYPDDVRGHYFLARFDLLLNDRKEATAEYNLVKTSTSPDSLTYAAALTSIFSLEDQKTRLQDELSSMKTSEAIHLVDSMNLSPTEKELVKFEINMAQGSIATAMLRLATLRSLAPKSTPQFDAMEKDARTAAGNFKEISDRLHWYLYSSFCTGSCTATWARTELPKQTYSLLEYMRLVSNAARLYPLNPWVQDLAFHATLLSAPYEDLELFGDRILTAKGSIRVPFYSKHSLFYLVIDSTARRIYTETNPLQQSNESGSEEMADLIPFNLGFADITEISQKASADLATGSLASGSFALKLAPMGIAPNYAFMGLLQCLYGEAKQKEVTRNLGAFIAHAVQNDHIHLQLVDSHKLTHDWFTAGVSAFAVGEMIEADYIKQKMPSDMRVTALEENATQIASENDKQAAMFRSVRSTQKGSLGELERDVDPARLRRGCSRSGPATGQQCE
jgi:hypothetical protein